MKQKCTEKFFFPQFNWQKVTLGLSPPFITSPKLFMQIQANNFSVPF